MGSQRKGVNHPSRPQELKSWCLVTSGVGQGATTPGHGMARDAKLGHWTAGDLGTLWPGSRYKQAPLWGGRAGSACLFRLLS